MRISMFKFVCRVVVITGLKRERTPLAGLRLVEREMHPTQSGLSPCLPPMAGVRGWRLLVLLWMWVLPAWAGRHWTLDLGARTRLMWVRSRQIRAVAVGGPRKVGSMLWTPGCKVEAGWARLVARGMAPRRPGRITDLGACRRWLGAPCLEEPVASWQGLSRVTPGTSFPGIQGALAVRRVRKTSVRRDQIDLGAPEMETRALGVRGHPWCRRCPTAWRGCWVVLVRLGGRGFQPCNLGEAWMAMTNVCRGRMATMRLE